RTVISTKIYASLFRTRRDRGTTPLPRICRSSPSRSPRTLCADRLGDAETDLAERTRLIIGEGVEDEVADEIGVDRCCGDDHLGAGFGQSGDRDTTVVQCGGSTHPSAPFEANDGAREPGQCAVGEFGEHTHRQGPALGIGEGVEDAELEVSETPTVLQL